MTEHQIYEEGPYCFTSMPKQVGNGVWRVDVVFEFKENKEAGGTVKGKVHTLSANFDDEESAREAGVDFGFERAMTNRTGL